MYIVVNLFITLTQVFEGLYAGKTLRIIFSDFSVYAVWIIWGISLFFHTLKVFKGADIFFSKDWEAKKIREYMNEKN